ncbi:hypothetical protein [Streptomyces longispororuber]|uniref:hypothetical protein n=1 Tax=Streptomyces longispororuber TaxID=68230 RepID=UPI00210DE742|nr:hypothetical protein [Streptomyces longispororuber]MCQ4213337.1 hypothetical protein [Streptomyces longispororuber]
MAIGRDDPLGAPPPDGPGSDRARVFAAHELHGHAAPGEAWTSFTARWNWAATLPHAVPTPHAGSAPAVRRVPGGFSLSGSWQAPRTTGRGRWLVLPLSSPRRPPDARIGAGHRLPDLYVVPSAALPAPAGTALRDRAATPLAPDAPVRLDGFYVPAGRATYSGGRALHRDHAPFVWTAVAGIALGAARRLTRELSAPAAHPSYSSCTTVAAPQPNAMAAGLGTLLRHERLGFTADLYNGPGLGRLIPLAARGPLPDRIARAAALAHHVVTAAYEHTALLPADDGELRHLEALLQDCAAPLQHLRSTVDLLSPGGQHTGP